MFIQMPTLEDVQHARTITFEFILLELIIPLNFVSHKIMSILNDTK